MRSNADAVLNDRLSSDTEALAEWTATQKLRNDPRIYPFGRFLRATSLDELPSFGTSYAAIWRSSAPGP